MVDSGASINTPPSGWMKLSKKLAIPVNVGELLVLSESTEAFIVDCCRVLALTAFCDRQERRRPPIICAFGTCILAETVLDGILLVLVLGVFGAWVCIVIVVRLSWFPSAVASAPLVCFWRWE